MRFRSNVEDYYQVSAFADVVKRDAWDDYESRVCQNTYRLLQLLEEHDAKATFFVLGWVAQRFPELVQNIFAEGHEIGCHGYWHQLIYHLTPDQFQTDLRMATTIIEDASGHKVESYRAPSFSIVEQSLWALDVLIDEGYRYDSSIFPIRHDRYGLPGADRFPHRIQRTGGSICEFPLTVHPIGKYNLPIAGGGYFRFFPAALSIRLLRQVNEKQRQPFIFYLHPWEIDPQQPRIAAGLRSRFRHYHHLSRTEDKLKRLLTEFKFQTVGQTLRNFASLQVPKPNTSRIAELAAHHVEDTRQ